MIQKSSTRCPPSIMNISERSKHNCKDVSSDLPGSEGGGDCTTVCGVGGRLIPPLLGRGGGDCSTLLRSLRQDLGEGGARASAGLGETVL